MVADAYFEGAWTLPRGRPTIVNMFTDLLSLHVPVSNNSSNGAFGSFSNSKTWNSLHLLHVVFGLNNVFQIMCFICGLWFVTACQREIVYEIGGSPFQLIVCYVGRVRSQEVLSVFFDYNDISTPVLFKDIIKWVNSFSSNQKIEAHLSAHLPSSNLLLKETNSRLHNSDSKSAVVKEI
ncbi:unnamed protein product, partial [Thlaspi arvense]